MSETIAAQQGLDYRYCIVGWVDTKTTPGWIENHENAYLAYVFTGGWLIYEDENVVKLSHTLSQGYFADITTIPKTLIGERAYWAKLNLMDLEGKEKRVKRTRSKK